MAQETRTVLTVFRALTDDFEKNTKKASNEVGLFSRESVANLAKVAGGFLATKLAFDNFTQTFRELGQLGKLSDSLDVSPDFLRGLQQGAKDLNFDFEKAIDLVREFNIRLGEAKDGTGPALEGLRLINLELQDLEGLTAEESLIKVAESLSQIEDKQKRVFAAGELFGGAGEDLLPLLDQGEEGLRKFIELAQEFGGPISREDLERIEMANQAINRMGNLWDTIFQNLAIELAPALTDISNLIADLAKSLRDVLNISSSTKTIWEDIQFSIAAAAIEFKRFTGGLTDDQADAALDLLTRESLGEFDEPSDAQQQRPQERSLQDSVNIKQFSDEVIGGTAKAFDVLNPNKPGSVQNDILQENKKVATNTERMADALEGEGVNIVRVEV